MNLYLVQHAEAKPESEDPERHLTEQGFTTAREMAGFASERAGIRVARMVHSGKARARETAEALAERLRPPGGVQAADGLDPMADPKIWTERATKSAEDIMLVGHLPHLNRLASLLLYSDPEKTVVAFQMGAIIRLQRDKTGNWAIAWMVVPSML